ncbi:MAG: hypothetical protein AAGB12_08195 [Pseudomonadota bacterium]
MLVELFENDLEAMLQFEKKAFPKSMQASYALYAQRFQLGHKVYASINSAIEGIISFSFGNYDVSQPQRIPNNFYDWSTQVTPKAFDTVFIYNLGLSPLMKGTQTAKALVYKVLDFAKKQGCTQVLAEGPIPSYAGNHHIKINLAIRNALDYYAKDGITPNQKLLFRDPHLCLYRKWVNCRIVRVLPNFIPQDVPSGGFRVMLYRDLLSLDTGLFVSERYSKPTYQHAANA